MCNPARRLRDRALALAHYRQRSCDSRCRCRIGSGSGTAASAVASVPAGAASAVADDAAAPVETAAASSPALVDPLEPEVPVDLNDSNAHTDLWARVRRGFAMPDLDNPLVHDSEQWYATRPDYVQRMTERGSRYLFHIVEEVERRGMPTELALLPFIESAYNPQAMSSAKASGMWQFMPSTGRLFDLKQNVFRDDRRDVLASTRAALDYLGRLYGMFGDWQLALAAYNWGEGNVQRAIARNQRAGLPTDYSHLRMPAETRGYVPKLQAVKNIVLRPDAFALSLPPVANHPYFLSVPVTRDIDVSVAAKLAGLEVDDFKDLNPQMNRPVILAAGTPYVLLPYDNADRFAHELAEYEGQTASWTAWVAPKTMRPADAAKRVGMSESEFREVNRIPPRMLVKGGSVLVVPRIGQRTADVSAKIVDSATIALTPDGPRLRRVSFRAGKKETVSTVARRYRVNRTEVARWNNVHASATFKPGQIVVVYVSSRHTVKHSSRSRTAHSTRSRQSARKYAHRPSKTRAVRLANGGKPSRRARKGE